MLEFMNSSSELFRGKQLKTTIRTLQIICKRMLDHFTAKDYLRKATILAKCKIRKTALVGFWARLPIYHKCCVATTQSDWLLFGRSHVVNLDNPIN